MPQNLSNFILTVTNDWGALHPAVIHFPIGLLTIAPLFVLLGAFFPQSRKNFYITAALLLWLGTSTVFLSVSTGEEASEHLKLPPEIVSTLEIHSELAEQSRWTFGALTLLLTFYTLVFLPKTKTKGQNQNAHLIFLSAFLLFYIYSLCVLYNAAHQGGKLVHQHGIRSNFYNTP